MDLTAMIFPHASVPEKTLKAVLCFFERVKIGRPWFMDPAAAFLQEAPVQLLYPTEDLKPADDFRRLLAEYRQWIKRNKDKKFDAFQAVAGANFQAEEASWEIRSALRAEGSQPRDMKRQSVLKWHLHLHLYEEMEREAREAEELLRTLKGKSSPLKGALDETEEPPGPLADLPDFGGWFPSSPSGLSRVLEAWFSLFKEHLQDRDVLLTFSPSIFQYLCEAWNEWARDAGSETMEFHAPDFSRFDLRDLLEARREWLNTRDGDAMRKAVLRFLKADQERTGATVKFIDPKGPAEKERSISLKRFDMPRQSAAHPLVRNLSGKIIGLLGGEHAHGA